MKIVKDHHNKLQNLVRHLQLQLKTLATTLARVNNTFIIQTSLTIIKMHLYLPLVSISIFYCLKMAITQQPLIPQFVCHSLRCVSHNILKFYLKIWEPRGPIRRLLFSIICGTMTSCKLGRMSAFHRICNKQE